MIMANSNKFPNSKNVCSLRGAKAIAKSDALTTRIVQKYFDFVKSDYNRLQVVLYEGYGSCKKGILYHMQKYGYYVSNFNYYDEYVFKNKTPSFYKIFK